MVIWFPPQAVRLAISALCLCAVAAACSRNDQNVGVEKSVVEVIPLQQALERGSGEVVHASVQEAKRRGFLPEDVRVAAAAWNSRQHIGQRLSNHDAQAVVVALADFLLSADANRLHSVPPDTKQQMRVELLQAARSDAWPTSLRAISAMAAIDEPATVAFLVEVGKKGAPDHFRAAVLALARMCDPSAAVALASMRDGAMTSEQRRFVTETVDAQGKYKQTTGVCAR
ncbi:MAG: hypothetical protein DPW14_17260 [Planctomycetes bacterium]|jgi:hypothetical protein|nr:hypothetical protein [Planctomycetota bacterium]